MAQRYLWILLLCLQTCRLGKPQITQSLMTSLNSTCYVTLTCSVDKEEENVTYSWSPLGETGNVIRISRTPDSQELTYTCTAQNPISNSSDSISAQQLCADTATGLRSRHTGLLSGLAGLFLFILIVPLVLLFLLRRRGEDAASKKTIYTYVMVTRAAPPAEGRIYDEIPPSKELPANEDPDRVYATLQMDKMGKTSTQDGKPPGISAYENVV
uniref:CD84 molecule n=1 Tax=Neovison vison TaxID=452646 RepID=A0A8C7A4W9_NEOVI